MAHAFNLSRHSRQMLVDLCELKASLIYIKKDLSQKRKKKQSYIFSFSFLSPSVLPFSSSLLWDKVFLCILDWPQTYVAQVGLQLLLSLPLLHKCRNQMCHRPVSLIFTLLFEHCRSNLGFEHCRWLLDAWSESPAFIFSVFFFKSNLHYTEAQNWVLHVTTSVGDLERWDS